MAAATFPTKAETDEFCQKQEREDGHVWLCREREDGSGEAVSTSLQVTADKPTGTATESRPKPPEPGDPRDGKANPYWGM